MKISTRRALRTLLVAGVPALLAACGGDDDYPYGPATCSVGDRKAWLGAYMDDWYFWYRQAPNPSPGAYSTVEDYFYAQLYTGTDANFPADRWSYVQSTADFNRFFGDGQALGYGIAVAGNEVAGGTNLPLYVRHVEPKSDAALRGVVRGDRVMSVNGRSADDMIAADDFSAFSASSAGQTATLVLRNTSGVDRTVVVTAGVYALTPVPTTAVVTSPGGRKMGYVMVKDMISQASGPLETAFAQFKTAGINDVVLDLRYNGGGLVSVGRLVASYVAGTQGSGSIYASLLYNDKAAYHYNVNYGFGALSSAAGVPRVYVLTGARTCSASEQVINGLRGIGVDVVAIGDTTCGKPVGFNAVDDTCGTTYAATTFETVNENYEGRYFDGFAPTCAVSEDFTAALGSPDEPLLAAARSYADGNACPASSRAAPLGLRKTMAAKQSRGAPGEPAEVTGMLAR